MRRLSGRSSVSEICTGEPACKVFSAVSSFLVGTSHNQLYWVIALM